MNKHITGWRTPVTGALLFATAVSAEQNLETYQYSTNRVTVSLRFGLNIQGKFTGAGGPAASGQRTPSGGKRNYDDGYVLTDISGNAGNQSWYWGYDNSSQVNASGPNTIDFHRDTVVGGPASSQGDNTPYVGAEITYNWELGKDDWRHIHYGLEAALNFMPISFGSGGLYNVTLSRLTDTYGYTPGTTPPGAPYEGSFGGPGFVINTPVLGSTTTLVPGATLLAQQKFDANLWGFRLGPYVEMPLSKRWSLHASAGLAMGLMDAEAHWRETITLPAGGGTTRKAGGGDDFDVLGGYYLGLDAAYQFDENWALQVGVQFQDMGNYTHNFDGRAVELNLRHSLFIQVGVSYSF
jgi:hypothetical protein